MKINLPIVLTIGGHDPTGGAGIIKDIEAIKSNKEEIRLCEVKNSNSYITVEKPKWRSSLDSALQFYINKEEYEKCSKIKDLIDKL